ncbi:hypothetical protein HOD20_05210 [archaeon]|jgi:hypothetical protein|nr:hypothetical protein [archaeon]MBT4351903.1 hypothetical protein [archaeon]MBT4648367.1 hypothetical protein [archaeon]MBT6821566.1 hypothetical protein [archaeon]MBT7391604.1 hypothetical protein [archaeon]
MKIRLFCVIIVFAFILLPISYAEPVCEFSYKLNRDNTMELLDFYPYPTNFRDTSWKDSKLVAKFYDGNNLETDLVYVLFSFLIPDSMGYRNSIIVSISRPCNSDWKTLKFFYDKKEIYSQQIDDLMCNNNNICENYETSLICSDCAHSSQDGWCELVEDNICDPDCISGDKDCEKDNLILNNEKIESNLNNFIEKEIETSSNSYYLIPLMLLLFLAIFFLYYKHSTKFFNK